MHNITWNNISKWNPIFRVCWNSHLINEVHNASSNIIHIQQQNISLLLDFLIIHIMPHRGHDSLFGSPFIIHLREKGREENRERQRERRRGHVFIKPPTHLFLLGGVILNFLLQLVCTGLERKRRE